MSKIYECSTCGVITESAEEVCRPQRLENMGVYCGEKGNTDKMCGEMKEHVSYVCGSCGRPAEQADLICEPRVVG